MLEKIQKSLGFIPNLMAIFANNAIVLEGYLALGAVFEKGSFTPRERQIILLAGSVENNCNYCAPAHSQIAKTLLRTPAEVIAAVQNNTPVPDAKLNGVVHLVKELVRERGDAKEKTIQNFLAAGYKKEQVMELPLGIALKTISNYLDHISPTPLDRASAGKNK
jgi:AhpD family alkylhydroperoxidase